MNILKHADATIRSLLGSDGVIPFWPGRFATTRDRPAFAARLYAESAQLQRLFEDTDLGGKVLDVGCGYGRLAPWLAALSDEYVGVEPDDDARRRATNLYPTVAFRDGHADELPLSDESVEVAVSWTVLQHLDDDTAAAACEELQRVATKGVILCEKTHGGGTRVLYPRHPSWYSEHLPGFERSILQPRDVEPERRPAGERVMVFVK